MPRRPIERLVAGLPPANLYKPAGVPVRRLETIDLAVDELEAMRLVDQEGLSHEEAAHYLGVSRQTVGRVVESARRKVADALLGGKALAIGGGAYRVAAAARCCEACGARWAVGDDEALAGDERCPACGSDSIGVCRGLGPGGHGHAPMQGGGPGGGRGGGHGAGGRGRGGGGRGGQGEGAGGRGARQP